MVMADSLEECPNSRAEPAFQILPFRTLSLKHLPPRVNAMNRFRLASSRRLIAAFCGILALTGTGVVVGKIRNSSGPLAPQALPIPSASGSTPTPPTTEETADPALPLRTLTGRGPFVVYTFGRGTHVGLRAVDLGAIPRTTLELGDLPAKPHDWLAASSDGGGVALVLDDGSIWSIRRGTSLRRVVQLEGDLRAAALSPDGRRLATAVTSGNGVAVALHDTTGRAKLRPLVEFGTASDENGGEFEFLWNTPDEIIVVDGCHCDGGIGYTNLGRISLKTATFSEYEFLNDHETSGMGLQRGAMLGVFDDVPPVDCFEEPSPCEHLMHTLRVVDLEGRTMRSLAKRRDDGFVGPEISPNGKRIAAAGPGRGDLEIYDVAAGKRLSRTRVTVGYLSVRAWLDSRRLVAVIGAPGDYSPEGSGRLLLVEVASNGKPQRPQHLFDGVAFYAGWIR